MNNEEINLVLKIGNLYTFTNRAAYSLYPTRKDLIYGHVSHESSLSFTQIPFIVLENEHYPGGKNFQRDQSIVKIMIYNKIYYFRMANIDLEAARIQEIKCRDFV